MKYLFLPLLFLLTTAALAQRPAPGLPQSAPMLVRGGTVHTGTGRVIENGAVGFAEGKITYVGPAADAPSGYQTVDAGGQHVYPGLILPNTTLGLVEIAAVRASRDQQEAGTINPNVRSLVAFNTDSDIIPTVRSNGVLLVQATPRGGTLAGTSSLMHLDGWNWEDAAVRADDGIHVYWP
ncbi:MAG: amidohydrolase, partial [Catalinimonas sp.]